MDTPIPNIKNRFIAMMKNIMVCFKLERIPSYFEDMIISLKQLIKEDDKFKNIDFINSKQGVVHLQTLDLNFKSVMNELELTLEDLGYSFICVQEYR